MRCSPWSRQSIFPMFQAVSKDLPHSPERSNPLLQKAVLHGSSPTIALPMGQLLHQDDLSLTANPCLATWKKRRKEDSKREEKNWKINDQRKNKCTQISDVETLYSLSSLNVDNVLPLEFCKRNFHLVEIRSWKIYVSKTAILSACYLYFF